MFKPLHSVFLSTLILSGCATESPSIPANYTGPTAQITDSTKVFSTGKADFYFVQEIDGNHIDNSFDETSRRFEEISRSYVSKHFPAQLPNINRPVIANKPIKLQLTARTYYAPGVINLPTNNAFILKGELKFTPKENHKYQVKGFLSEEYSAIWIEDTANNQIVGQKIEHGTKPEAPKEDPSEPIEPSTSE